MTVRRAVPADAAEMGAIHTQAWAESYSGLLTPRALAERTADTRAARWRQSIEAGEAVFVATDQNGLTGLAMARRKPADSPLPQDGAIDALYVLRRAQRRGLGRALMSAMAHALHAQGCRQAALWVIEGNDPAIRFYTALGGQPVASQSFSIADWTGTETAYAWDDVSVLFAA